MILEKTNFNIDKKTIERFTLNGIIFYYLKIKSLNKKNDDICYNVNSPFRKDRNPSFSVYRRKDINTWNYTDFGTGERGDVFTFASRLYSLSLKTQFPEILSKMAHDMSIDIFEVEEVDKLLHGEISNLNFTQLIGKRTSIQSERGGEDPKSEYELTLFEISYDELNIKEHAFMLKYGWKIELMKLLNVVFLRGYEKYFGDGKYESKMKNPEHVWLAYKYKGGAKIYSPEPKRFWYVGKTKARYSFGTPNITEVLEEPKYVFLTAGEKDVLTLMSRGYEAMCLSSETKSVTREDLKGWYSYHRYNVVVLYDNDATGVTQTKKLHKELKLKYIQLPAWLKEKGGKDISDFFVMGGTKEEFDLLVADQLKKTDVPTSTEDIIPENEKRISVRTAQQRLEDAKGQLDILPHCSVFFQYNELVIAFGDTGKGKSIMAVAIADAISKGQSFLGLENAYGPICVLYYDFELSDKQFEKRYSNQQGIVYPFNSNFFIDNMDFTEIVPVDKSERFEDNLIEKIKHNLLETLAKVVIIDNMTFLSTQSAEDSQVALNLMRKLKELKTEMNISILVLAHTPKRTNPYGITIQDLAGSKHISNFADNVFALGQCNTDKDLRYLVQVKPSRSGELLYDKSNVVVCEIEKQDNFLTFRSKGFAKEADLLKCAVSDEGELIEKAKALKTSGMQYRSIADELGVSKSKVGRWLKDNAVPSQDASTAGTMGQGQNISY